MGQNKQAGEKAKKMKGTVSASNQAAKSVAKRAKGRKTKPKEANPKEKGGQPG